MTAAAQSVSKWFGQKVALSDVTVEFAPGVTGLLGPNGAGKTTLLRVLTGLQVPSQGSVRLLGVDPRADRSVYSKVAMVPEDEAVYPDLSARGFCELKATLAGIRPADMAVNRALEYVELVDAADRRMGEYSKGMKQRAKVAAALVTDPEVLVLDEPLNGADPVQRAQLIELFIRLGTEGKTLVVSSHVLAEVERMTHRVVAMVDGRLAATGDLEGLRAAMTDKPRQVHIRSSDSRALGRSLLSLESVAGIVIRGDEIELTTTDPRRLALELPVAARDGGITVFEVSPADESMESVFRYLVEAAR